MAKKTDYNASFESESEPEWEARGALPVEAPVAPAASYGGGAINLSPSPGIGATGTEVARLEREDDGPAPDSALACLTCRSISSRSCLVLRSSM